LTPAPVTTPVIDSAAAAEGNQPSSRAAVNVAAMAFQARDLTV
jgi:hypothetical protein